jgi:hypothetical protein
MFLYCCLATAPAIFSSPVFALARTRFLLCRGEELFPLVRGLKTLCYSRTSALCRTSVAGLANPLAAYVAPLEKSKVPLLQLCSTFAGERLLVGRPGFEPGLSASKADDLPLVDRPVIGVPNVRFLRGGVKSRPGGFIFARHYSANTLTKTCCSSKERGAESH